METSNFITGRQGDGATAVFAGKSNNIAIEQLYAESAPFFAQIIKENLVTKNSYRLLDIGTFKGELLGKILFELGDRYSFHKIGIDLESEALAENKVIDEKIVCDATGIPIGDNSIDVTICRYVLQWNSKERQKNILAEIKRTLKGFAIIQHAGADNEETKEWQDCVHKMFFGGMPKVSRSQGYFSSSAEVESWMNELGISFKKVQDRRIAPLSDVLLEKYKLTNEELRDVKTLLGDKDYIFQTTWVVEK